MPASVSLSDINATAREWVARRDVGLSAAESRALASWRSADTRHEEAFTRYAATWAALGRPRQTGRGEALTREIATLIRRQRARRLTVASAALALLLVIGGVWQFHRSAAPTAPSTAIVLLPQHQILPDGSIVLTPLGSEVAIDYSGPLRRVTLRRGEAHFQVAKNPDRPFVVAAGGIEFRAVGTAFAVQLGPKVGLLVTEGRVAVDRPSVDQTEPETLTVVDAGNSLSLDPSATAIPAAASVTDSEMAERLAWRNPRVEFSGTPLGEVVTLLNQHNQVRFVIADPELAQIPLSGLFRADDPDTFAHLLATGFPIRAERRGDEILLCKVR